MGPNWIGLLIIGVIVLFVFGKSGKISSIMGDMGKGITSFRKGLKEGVEDASDKADEALDVTPKKKDTAKR